MLLVDGGREASMNRLPGNESRFNYLSCTVKEIRKDQHSEYGYCWFFC